MSGYIMSGVRSGVARFLLNPIKNWSGPMGNSHWPPAGSPAPTAYRFTSGMSAGGLGMSSPKSLGAGSEGFAWLICLAA